MPPLEVEGLISTGEEMIAETKAESEAPEPHATAPKASTFIAPLKRSPEGALNEVADRATGSGARVREMRDASTHIDSSHIESPGPTSATIVTPQCMCGNGVLPLLSRLCAVQVHPRTLSCKNDREGDLLT